MKHNSLSNFEVGVIKNLLNRRCGKNRLFSNQEITGVINRRRGNPSKDISPARISQIRNDKITKYIKLKMVSDSDADKFIESNNDQNTIDVSPMSDAIIEKLFPFTNAAKTNFNITETDIIECKKSYNLPMKTLAAFSNNKGGYLLLGVENQTWKIIGVKENNINKFDFNQLNQSVLSSFGVGLALERKVLEINHKKVVIFYVPPAQIKPIIFSKNSNSIPEGHIYYRYPGEDRLITPVDLQKVIEDRIKKLSETVLMKHISSILKIGIEDAAILDLSSGQVEGKSGSFSIDEKLLPKLSFVKEGEFVEKLGAPTLKLIGELKESSNVVVKVSEDLIKRYPFSYTELVEGVMNKISKIRTPHKEINEIIKKKKIKSNTDYSAYNFRTKVKSDEYLKTKKVPGGTTSIYNMDAIDFIVKEISNKMP